MLKRISSQPAQGSNGRFAIVAAKYNQEYVDSLLRAAESVLNDAYVEDVVVVRVPGAFEIPVVASRLASDVNDGWAAIICLGVVFQGETRHADHVSEAVSHALARLQMTAGVPVIHGVGLFGTIEQAKARCLDWETNRGREAALTALEMADVMRQIA